MTPLTIHLVNTTLTKEKAAQNEWRAAHKGCVFYLQDEWKRMKCGFGICWKKKDMTDEDIKQSPKTSI